MSTGDSRAIELPARVDSGNAVEVLARLQEAADAAGPAPLALDLAPLKEFDSSALSLLLQLARSRTVSGHLSAGNQSSVAGRPPLPVPSVASGDVSDAAPPLFLLNPPAKLQELADLYGVGEMLFGATVGSAEGAAAR